MVPNSPDGDTQSIQPASDPREIARQNLQRLNEAIAKPERIGPYKILETLGEGGMGVVYLAEQVKPIHRRVALKIIKLGMDSKQVLARFDTEREALALMNHPNVAKVFDAGATETGRPYFAMEYVPGIPITDYCDKHRLTTEERLRLFMDVCHAVQHAHQKGIIHRDIKPSNILVSVDASVPIEPRGSSLRGSVAPSLRGFPKVIDFGVAKATQHRLTERTLFTEQGQLIGTPGYMSPEQAEMTKLDVDTRTDIYSLGVLLYELLVGAMPFDTKTLLQAGLAEIQRIIREVDPPKPSTRLSSLASEPRALVRADTGQPDSARTEVRGSSIDDIAHRRHTEPKTLIRQIRGDLDWIVMRAMEKDRTRRYDTANGLALEIQRYLSNEPVVAGPPSAIYRARKFVRRNRVVVSATAGMVLMLIAGIAASSLFAIRETRARADAVRAGHAEAEQRTLAEQERDRALQATQEARQQTYFGSITAASAALAANEIATVRRQLQAAPPEFCNWEWRYLWGQIDPGWPVLEGHSSGVTGIAFSPDSDRIASASLDGTIRVWDSRSGRELQQLIGRDGRDRIGQLIGFGPTSVAFSPDGTRLACGTMDGTARIWNTLAGRESIVFRGHESVIASVNFSPDGTRVASASWDNTVRVWDASTGKEFLRLEHPKGVNSVDFSPNGRRLVSGCGYHMFTGKTVHVWDAASGQELLVLRGHEHEVASVAFSPDGDRLASGSADQTVRIWDANRGEAVSVLKDHTGWVKAVAFSPDGTRLASGGQDKTVRLWDVPSGRSLAVFRGHEDAIEDVTFSPDGSRLASGSRDGDVRLWTVSNEAGQPVLRGHAGGVTSMVISPDGKLLAAGSGNGKVRVWDVTRRKVIYVIKHHAGGPLGATLRTGMENLGLSLLQMIAPEVAAFELAVTSVAFSADGTRLASASFDKTVRLWDAATGRPGTILKHDSEVTYVAFSPGGSLIATTSVDPIVSVWDVLTGEQLHILRTGRYPIHVQTVAFSPDGATLAVGANDGTVRLWNPRTGQELGVLRGPDGIIRAVAYSPDGIWLAAGASGPGGDRSIRIFNNLTRKEAHALVGHEAGVSGVAFSPDSTRLVSASADTTIRLWDVLTGEELIVLRGHDNVVTSAAFSPDASYIASGSFDQTVRLWFAPHREGGRSAEQTTKPGTRPTDNRSTANELMSQGFRLEEEGKDLEAEALYQQALKLFRGTDTLHRLSLVLERRGLYNEAEAAARELVAIGKEWGEVDVNRAMHLVVLASILERQGKLTEAEPLCEEANRILESAMQGNWRAQLAKGVVGSIRVAQQRFREAKELLLDYHEKLQAAGPLPKTRRREMLDRLVRLYESWDAAEPGKGYAEKAAEWRAKLDELGTEAPRHEGMGERDESTQKKDEAPEH